MNPGKAHTKIIFSATTIVATQKTKRNQEENRGKNDLRP